MTPKLKHKYGGPHRVEHGVNRDAWRPMNDQSAARYQRILKRVARVARIYRNAYKQLVKDQADKRLI